MIEPKIEVLVVEDEVIVRLGIAAYLYDEGFAVLEAANADEPLEILNRNPEVQIVFTDVDMPGSMDGLALAAAVNDRWPLIKIVVTSGHRLVRTEHLPNLATFVPKPYTPDMVIRVLRKLASTD